MSAGPLIQWLKLFASVCIVFVWSQSMIGCLFVWLVFIPDVRFCWCSSSFLDLGSLHVLFFFSFFMLHFPCVEHTSCFYFHLLFLSFEWVNAGLGFVGCMVAILIYNSVHWIWSLLDARNGCSFFLRLLDFFFFLGGFCFLIFHLLFSITDDPSKTLAVF